MKNITISRPTKGLFLLTIICIGLEFTRFTTRQTTDFSFLIWNLFLAWIPLFFALVARRMKHKLLIISNLAVWLLFFPNAPYIITDLLHLQDYSQNIIWYDSLLIFAFALTGLLAGLYSLQIAHQVFDNLLGKTKSWFIVFGSLLLLGFGVYLGRFSRWNSWDLFTHPFRLMRDIFHQLQNPVAIQLTLIFAVVMMAFYIAFSYFISSSTHELKENVA